MSTHKSFDKICCVICALTLVLAILFMNAESFGIQKASSAPGYETRLFDTSKVHTVNIVMAVSYTHLDVYKRQSSHASSR